jgi:hypothetical protein
MRTRTRLVLAGIVAALALAAVGSASANRLSFTNKAFRTTWRAVEFSTAVIEGVVRCPITIEGSFHSSTVRKVISALVGYITRATAATAVCTGGRATVLQETLPWHIRYSGFQGTLPNITHVDTLMVGGGMRVEFPGAETCLLRTAGGLLLLRLTPEGIFLTWRYLAQMTGGFFCQLAGEANVAADGSTLTVLGSTTAISVRLI